MTQVYDLGAYRALAKGVQEFFLQTQRDAHEHLFGQQDTYDSVDVSCKHDNTRRGDDALSPTEEEYAMPPKGWTAGREPTEVKAVRLSKSLIDRIAQHVERLQVQFRFGRINEGMAIRDLIEIGLDTVEGHAPQPQVAPVTQPAIPLAAEPAPATEAPPVQSAYAPPGTQPCTVNANHPPYKLTLKECPMCATNRRTRESKARKREQAQEEQETQLQQ